MVNLALLQSQFQNYLLHAEPAFTHWVALDKQFSAEKRLNVYYQAYRLRLLEILKLDYPKAYQLLGPERFEQAFMDYLQQYPSQHFSVRYFGQHFSEFLSNPPFDTTPYLAEMAKFEWAIIFTTDALDAPVMHKKDLHITPQDWAYLRLTFHPSLTSHYFAWNTPQLWQALECEQTCQPASQTPVRWLFWRKEMKSYFQSCTHHEDILFQALAKGENFSTACEQLLDHLPAEQIAQFSAQTLLKWLNEQMFCAFSI